jgi:hypothetical protein
MSISLFAQDEVTFFFRLTTRKFVEFLNILNKSEQIFKKLQNLKIIVLFDLNEILKFFSYSCVYERS